MTNGLIIFCCFIINVTCNCYKKHRVGMYTFKPYYNIYIIYIYNKNFRTQGGIVPLFGNSYYVTFYPNDRDGNIVTVTKNTEPSCPFWFSENHPGENVWFRHDYLFSGLFRRTFAADLKIHRGFSKARELEIRIQFRSLKEHRARSSIRRRLGLI